MNTLILKINLPGVLLSPIKHSLTQSYSARLITGGTVSKRILHTDREVTQPHKRINLQPEIVFGFIHGECPYWEKPSVWKHKTNTQKLVSHLNRFDEGFGYTYEFIE